MTIAIAITILSFLDVVKPRDVANTFMLFLYYIVTPKLLGKGVELGLWSAGIVRQLISFII